MRTSQLLLITTLAFGMGVARSAGSLQLADAANWTKIGGTDRFVVLINPPSVERAKVGKTEVLKAWVLYDFLEPAKNPAGTFRSAKILEYFKCADNTSGQKSLVFYTNPMGEGDVVKAVTHLDREMRFAPLVPGSADAEVGNLVCNMTSDSKG